MPNYAALKDPLGIRILVAATIGLISPPFNAHAVAQEADSTSKQIMSVLRESERHNRMVRIDAASPQITGRVRVLSDSTFQLSSKAYSLAGIRRIDVRIANPDPLWNGVLIGSVISPAILGTLLTQFAIDMSESRVSDRERFSYYAGSVVFGVLVGGGVDAARESAPSWKTVYAGNR